MSKKRKNKQSSRRGKEGTETEAVLDQNANKDNSATQEVSLS